MNTHLVTTSMKHTAGHFLLMVYINMLLQETVALQIDGHQLIERTQKQYPKNKPNTPDQQNHTLFVHICSVVTLELTMHRTGSHSLKLHFSLPSHTKL